MAYTTWVTATPTRHIIVKAEQEHPNGQVRWTISANTEKPGDTFTATRVVPGRSRRFVYFASTLGKVSIDLTGNRDRLVAGIPEVETIVTEDPFGGPPITLTIAEIVDFEPETPADADPYGDADDTLRLNVDDDTARYIDTIAALSGQTSAQLVLAILEGWVTSTRSKIAAIVPDGRF